MVNDFGEAIATFVAMPETRQIAQPKELNATNINRKAATRASLNAVRSDFADAGADASAATLECKEFKYASKSDTDAASLPLESVLHQHLLFRLKCFEYARKLTEKRSLHVGPPGCSRGFSIEHQPIKKENKMTISWLHKSVNPNVTNTLVVILDSNKI